VGGGDLALGAGDALRHRRGGDEEGSRDLLDSEAADQFQGQGNLGLRSQRRVATREEQPQPVVVHHAGVCGWGGVDHHGCLPVLGVATRLTTEPIERLAGRCGGEPPTGVRRNPGSGPVLERGHEGLARRILDEIDVAEAPDE